MSYYPPVQHNVEFTRTRPKAVTLKPGGAPQVRATNPPKLSDVSPRRLAPDTCEHVLVLGGWGGGVGVGGLTRVHSHVYTPILILTNVFFAHGDHPGLPTWGGDT